MRISLITPPSQNIEPMVPIFEKMGVKVDVNKVNPKADFILTTTQVWIEQVDSFHKAFPAIPIISYVLDFYKTVWTAPNPHNYNWVMYKHYLNKAVEIWCPSQEVVTRMEEETIGADKCKIIKLWPRKFEYTGEVADKRYVLQPMRPYLYDKNYGWLKKACYELGIPLIETNHKLTENQFQKVIAGCSFMCTEYHDASTGGMTLMEGYRLGKPVVTSDSKYMGARDYFGEKAIYFDDNSYENFKDTIKEVWENTPRLSRKECTEFIDTHNPSLEEMVTAMVERLKVLSGKQIS